MLPKKLAALVSNPISLEILCILKFALLSFKQHQLFIKTFQKVAMCVFKMWVKLAYSSGNGIAGDCGLCWSIPKSVHVK
jgi:hypothetical protein